MLGLSELSPEVRRNLVYEAIYAVSAGIMSGLALLAQVAVVHVLDGTATHVAILVAVLPACSILQPVWAAWARLVRLQYMALLSGALRVLPFLATSWITSAFAFTLGLSLYYLLAGPLSLAVPALYKYTYPDTHRGRIIGLLRLVQSIVTVPVLLGAAALMDWKPALYQIIYPVGGLLGLFGLFFYARLNIPDDLPHQRAQASELPTPKQIWHVLRRDELFRLFQSTIFLTGAGFLMSRPLWIYLLDQVFHLNQLEIALLVQVLPILLGALTSPWWGLFIDRTSPVAGRVAFAWMGIFAYGALFVSFWKSWLVMAWLGAVLRGVVLGASEVAQTTGNLYFALRKERAALYESISSLFQGIRGLILPFCGLALFAWMGIGLFLVPMVLNLWSLRLALKLWHLEQALRPQLTILVNDSSATPERGETYPSPTTPVVQQESD
ncbi:MAG: MFS transporter [Gemmatales bacterium]|nr:MFS transporter [Gemmatales bacterium]MDW8175210.1 MFS transporter [Gemmatales bacterium]